MSLNPSDLQAIQSFLQIITDQNWPGHRGGELKIRTADGRKAVIPVPVYRPPVARRYAPEEDDGLTELERDVLQAVIEHNGEAMTGEQIATAAGYEYGSRFREVLARLVRGGRLARGENGRGYRSPAA